MTLSKHMPFNPTLENETKFEAGLKELRSHTPAPWDVQSKGTYGDYIGNNDEIVCQLAVGTNMLANARLIAAAPELLGAALRGVAALEANGAPNCEAAKELRAAIAKAKGE